jgi:hypothetical protein
VARIALKLFDLLGDEHGLNDEFRLILQTAALRHDAAKSFSPADHEVRGAAMLLSDAQLTLRGWQRRAAAFLVRFHRDPDAGAAGLAEFRLPPGRAAEILTLLALLQSADGLDSRGVPTSAVIIRRKNRKLQVLCLVSAKLNKARRTFTRRRKFKLLRRVLGIELDVRVERTAGELAAAA